MGKRYHCDYCNKTFQDNLASRKRHLLSVGHQRLKKAHYDALRDPAEVLAAELKKTAPCRTFRNDGTCMFGESCRFSHLTPERKEELEIMILVSKRLTGGKIKNHDINDWLRQREMKAAGTSTEKPKEPEPEVESPKSEVPVYQLPDSLRSLANLPISVLPPPPSAATGAYEEWG